MILSSVEIERALAEERIVIDPLPRRPFDTTAVDLHLDSSFKIPKCGLQLILDAPGGNFSPTLQEIYETKSKPEGETFVLEQRRFVLGQTRETIDLPLKEDTKTLSEARPSCLAARVEGKSTLARCGLIVHFTAPTIHAGFRGKIALEMINLGAYPIRLRPGMPICQLIFEVVLGVPDPNPSFFQDQIRPDGSQAT